MRYAVISDIHGNIEALECVLKSLENQSIDEILFAGDYFGVLPFVDEVVERISTIEGAKVIKGNWENYLIDKKRDDVLERKYNQFNSLMWHVDSMKVSSYDYLLSLPKKLEWIDEVTGLRFVLVHGIVELYPETSFFDVRSSSFVKEHKELGYDIIDYTCKMNSILCSDHRVLERVKELPYDIYIFGHSHMQMVNQVAGKYYVNAGSCGLPFDGINSAPYTIIETSNKGVEIKECRARYDIEKVVLEAKASNHYDVASDWSEIGFTQLRSGLDEITYFFRHIKAIGLSRGDNNFPYSNAIWKEAMNSWEPHNS